MSKLFNYLKWFWANHVQKTLAGLLLALGSIDLAGFHDELLAVFGHVGYAVVRIGALVGILLRAIFHDSKPNNQPGP